MRGQFAGFYRPQDTELKALWEGGTIVLDANVLLNLYRYPESAREEMLTVLNDLGQRLWLPYQAALEFQRGRPSVLKEQKDRFREVREIATKAKTELTGRLDSLKIRDRHSLIDATDLTSVIAGAVDAFVGQLQELETKQVEVHQADALLGRVESLIEGRVGHLPTQQDLDDAKKESVQRFAYDMPPALQDRDKEKGESPRFSYGGLYYEASLGDLYLWKQIISYAAETKPSGVIFVTDDRKSDWWHIVESSGKKTLGPRPELVDEFQRMSGVSGFYMYQADQFLRYAKEMLAAKVSEESIEQVRATGNISDLQLQDFRAFAWQAEQAVGEWLERSGFVDIRSEHFGPFDFLVRAEGEGVHGFDVFAVRRSLFAYQRIRDRIKSAYFEIGRGTIDRATIVVVADSSDHAREVLDRLLRRPMPIPDDVEVVVGWVVEDGGCWTFEPIGHARSEEARSEPAE